MTVGGGPWGGGGVLADTDPPSFLGLTLATALTATTIQVDWNDAADDATLPASMLYELHWSKLPSDPFTVRAVSAPGDNSFVLNELKGGTTYYLRARARDEGGNLSTDGGVELTAATPSAGPSVTVISPAPATVVQANDQITFDVTDPQGTFARIMVIAVQDGIHEVVHDGEAFRGNFIAASSRSIVANGFRYRVLRSGGWISSPTIRVSAIDDEGTEATV